MDLVGYLLAALAGSVLTHGMHYLRRQRTKSEDFTTSKSDGEQPKRLRKSYRELEARVGQLEKDLPKLRQSVDRLGVDTARLNKEITALETNLRAVCERQDSVSEPPPAIDYKRSRSISGIYAGCTGFDAAPADQTAGSPDTSSGPNNGGSETALGAGPTSTPDTHTGTRSPDEGLRPCEIIVKYFDHIDAQARRRVEKIQEQYTKLLGQALVSVTDRFGAYVFEMSDSSLWVHPKPNAPLARYWEKAFPGADSYSRPIRRVRSVAGIRFVNAEEYAVTENGSFEVV